MSARPILPPSRSNEFELGHATSCRLQGDDVDRRHLHSESANCAQESSHPSRPRPARGIAPMSERIFVTLMKLQHAAPSLN